MKVTITGQITGVSRALTKATATIKVEAMKGYEWRCPDEGRAAVKWDDCAIQMGEDDLLADVSLKANDGKHGIETTLQIIMGEDGQGEHDWPKFLAAFGTTVDLTIIHGTKELFS